MLQEKQKKLEKAKREKEVEKLFTEP